MDFQFNTGSSLTGASGGAAEASGFAVSAGGSGSVIGFSFTGSVIPAGEGVLTTLTYTGDAPCVSDLIVSGPAGSALDASVDGCLEIVYDAPVPTCDDELACNFGAEGDCEYAVDNFDCDGNCAVDIDCAGECGLQL